RPPGGFASLPPGSPFGHGFRQPRSPLSADASAADKGDAGDVATIDDALLAPRVGSSRAAPRRLERAASAPVEAEGVLRQSRASGIKVDAAAGKGPTRDPEGQPPPAGGALAQRLGRVGLWTRELDPQPAEQVRTTVAELEELGW